MTVSLRKFARLPARGFTLIELVMVMAIIAILAAIAIPSYSAYTRKANRANAQQMMMDMAVRQGEILVDQRSYATDAQMATLMPLPTSISKYYTFSHTISTTNPQTFLITATAKSSQVPDGDLTLSSTGAKTPAAKW